MWEAKKLFFLFRTVISAVAWAAPYHEHRQLNLQSAHVPLTIRTSARVAHAIGQDEPTEGPYEVQKPHRCEKLTKPHDARGPDSEAKSKTTPGGGKKEKLTDCSQRLRDTSERPT